VLLIPAIDLRGGRCVRLLRGDFAAETRYDVEPRDLVRRYHACGAPWLHVVDLDGAREGAPGDANREVIETLASGHRVRLQVGGGLRSAASIDALLSAGASRIVMGSAAIDAPGETRDWLRRFGPDSIVLAFDVRLIDGVARCATHGWRTQNPLSLWDAVEQYASIGARHVLCTDVDRDGALTGPNLALYREALRRYPAIAWQASGGIRNVADLEALRSVGVSAAISGRALLEERIEHEELQPYWRDA
jgi:phosphoribosylformimino-5-aminoimidazole carboxamide ribotide isomerase